MKIYTLTISSKDKELLQTIKEDVELDGNTASDIVEYDIGRANER